MVTLGATHAVMEVSSHGLALHRVLGIHYKAAAFTNLTQDHLDFHQTMEEYFAAKTKLFTPEYLAEGARAVINRDDAYGAQLLAKSPGAITFSIDPGSAAELRPLAAPRYTLCLLYTSPSPRDISGSRMPSSA